MILIIQNTRESDFRLVEPAIIPELLAEKNIAIKWL
jgi:hypothetical protein